MAQYSFTKSIIVVLTLLMTLHHKNINHAINRTWNYHFNCVYSYCKL